ncbi:MAG: AAA family ATPase [Aeromonas sp.]
MTATIKRLHLQGYKSAADVCLDELAVFSVLAGPNGAGKSNVADGLAFFAAVVARGARHAIREFGGFSQIHCVKLKKEQARRAALTLEIELESQCYKYQCKLLAMDSAPQLEEQLKINERVVMRRKRGQSPVLSQVGKEASITLPDFPDEMSGLMLLSHSALYRWLSNVRVFRFDPVSAKTPVNGDPAELDRQGRNLATILAQFEKQSAQRETICEWLELLVPGMEKVATTQQRLDGTTQIQFKESGTRNLFPAHLISDGTIYALCIMAALLSRQAGLGLTLIEEPERGIHPNAIAELVNMMRECATPEHPVWVTTHSESVVRSASAPELWLVNKLDGKTVLKNAAKSSVPLQTLPLDKAWLMNVFDGGLPW